MPETFKSSYILYLQTFQLISTLQIAGATISKSLNRICGTFLAGFLAIGVHWIASQSGDQLEPLIIGASVFILGQYNTVLEEPYLLHLKLDI